MAAQGEAEGGAWEKMRATGHREGTGPVKRKTGNRPNASKNRRFASELPVNVGTSGGRDFRRRPGLPAVGTSDAGKQKNTLTCTHSTMWGKNMMDTNIFTGD